MFNSVWFNGQEFNGSGTLQKVVLLAASVSCGASVDTAPMNVQKGLASTVAVSVDVSPSLALTKVKPLRSSVSTGASATCALYRIRPFGGSSTVTTAALIGASFEWHLAADVTVDVMALMYPFDFLAEASVSTAVTSEADLTKVRMLGGTGSVAIDAEDDASFTCRNCFGSPAVSVDAIGCPDTIIGGIRYAEFGAQPAIDVIPECTIDPRKFFYVNAVVETSATGGYRRVRQQFGQGFGGATANVSMYANTSALGSEVLVDVAAVATMIRIARMSAIAVVEPIVDATASARRPLGALGVVNITTQAQAYRRAGMRTSVVVDTGATGFIKEAERLAGTVSVDVSATAEPIYFTMAFLSADASIDVDATVGMVRYAPFDAEAFVDVDVVRAELRLNVLSFEPAFRTVAVEPEESGLVVEPEPFTVTVTDDGATMQTFQKQPADVLPYDVDLKAWFDNINAQGDATDDIDTATAVVVSATTGSPSDLTIDEVVVVRTDPDDISSPGYRVKVWTSGGVNGATYKITVTMTSNAGRVKEVDFKLKIKEL